LTSVSPTGAAQPLNRTSAKTDPAMRLTATEYDPASRRQRVAHATNRDTIAAFTGKSL
jgi:YD repeat-containing protein